MRRRIRIEAEEGTKADAIARHNERIEILRVTQAARTGAWVAETGQLNYKVVSPHGTTFASFVYKDRAIEYRNAHNPGGTVTRI